MDPVQAAASITAVVNAIKKASDVAKRLKDVEMQEVLLDAQERALSLKEELVELRAENLSLKEQLEARLKLTFDGGAYWSQSESGRDGPFCSRCYEVDKNVVRLKPAVGISHRCPQCEQVFQVPSAPRVPDQPPLKRGLSVT